MPSFLGANELAIVAVGFGSCRAAPASTHAQRCAAGQLQDDAPAMVVTVSQ